MVGTKKSYSMALLHMKPPFRNPFPKSLWVAKLFPYITQLFRIFNSDLLKVEFSNISK